MEHSVLRAAACGLPLVLGAIAAAPPAAADELSDVRRDIQQMRRQYESELQRVWSTDLPRVNAQLSRLSLPPLDPQCTDVKGCPAKP